MAAAVAATTRNALAQLPELVSADQYETWRGAVLTSVDGMTNDPLIAPNFRVAFDAHVAAVPGGAVPAAYTLAQQTCLSLLNASTAASKVKNTARQAVGAVTSVDQMIRTLDRKRNWGQGDASQQEDRVQGMYKIVFEPARVEHGHRRTPGMKSDRMPPSGKCFFV